MSLAVAYDPVAYYPPELYDEYRMPYLLDKTVPTPLSDQIDRKLAHAGFSPSGPRSPSTCVRRHQQNWRRVG